MRFLFIKNPQICQACGSILSYGEEAVVIRIKHASGVIIPVFFHTNQCYDNWNHETFVNRLLAWRISATERPKQKRKSKIKVKLGRPKKYTNSTQARRLSALIFYHKKVGNTDKVQELENSLEGLKIASPTT